MTQIAPMLAVSDGAAAVRFYETAFGAEVLWRLDEGAETIAGLTIGGAPFFSRQGSTALWDAQP